MPVNFNEQVTGSVGTLPISGHPLLLSLVAIVVLYTILQVHLDMTMSLYR